MSRPLPNYFLADLGADAALSPQIITEACQSLRRNREQFLAPRSTNGLLRVLADLGEAWMDPDYPFRKRALEEGPEATGYSAPTLTAGLDGFFRQLTTDNMQALIQQDLGAAQRLDGFSQTQGEIGERRSAWARGPELMAHITAGNLPNPTLTTIVMGLLTRSAQFVKCARGAALIPRLFAHSIYDAEPKLAACLEIADWPGGSEALEAALFNEASLVTATGGDETLDLIRSRLPLSTRFLGYGHRVSFAYVTAESLNGRGAKKVVERAALDVSAWDQQGCLSPHVLYVQLRGGMPPEQFAESLGEELSRTEDARPRGNLAVEEAATIASRRAFYEVRAAHSTETRMWSSGASTAWTVVYETDPLFQFSCLNRFIHIKAVNDLGEALRHAESVRGRVSTVGLAAAVDEAPPLARQLAQWGATRVCPLGRMQSPPITWRHDGRPALADLIQWTDWEQ
ncbi:MAG: hypothetical protein HYR88_09065 [Verrucomicrobia bacterium]|nr:hypothetical protein [Verrucomicrobiota bacterium]MBI3870898.1 hypothetical protein [Verrucomicrobiota bacterium]